VEIIFFSTPTPAASARSYSSGTVAESWSAMPVESKTVISFYPTGRTSADVG